MDDMINNEMDIPKWMSTEKMILCQEDLGKGKAVDNDCKKRHTNLGMTWIDYK